MASELKISITDESAALKWSNDVMDINADFNKAMTEAAEALKETKEMADGTIVDELYDMGTDFLNAAQKVFEVINEISSTVNTVISSVTSWVESAGSAIKTVASWIGL